MIPNKALAEQTSLTYTSTLGITFSKKSKLQNKYVSYIKPLVLIQLQHTNSLKRLNYS